jgi:hypothetical protein
MIARTKENGPVANRTGPLHLRVRMWSLPSVVWRATRCYNKPVVTVSEEVVTTRTAT